MHGAVLPSSLLKMVKAPKTMGSNPVSTLVAPTLIKNQTNIFSNIGRSPSCSLNSRPPLPIPRAQGEPLAGELCYCSREKNYFLGPFEHRSVHVHKIAKSRM